MAHGKFRTCVGVAARSLLLIPRLLKTAVPVGKPWKKLGTPLATYVGISLPRLAIRLPI
jgi:hypothetical protein